MAQDIAKKDKKTRMAKYDPENAHAWNVILAEVRKLKAGGQRQHEIAKTMGVNRDTVSRWLSEERGGERTTFGAMLRYADALGIPYNNLLAKGELKPEAAAVPATQFSKAVAKVLEGFAQDDDTTVTDIAKQTGLPAVEVNAALAGDTQPSLELFHQLCKAIGVKDTIVLNRAEKLIEEEEKDTTASAAATRSA
ncbi:hypothetical protein SP90_13635 [Halodesulfovibrio spirochaetisodalis]|uniref:HTH cro/C1-type domain-containing protein n=1 Tax=Halodesulfovibrio spirochaetisodalis TaxID=1560234 RepID=A0A1B7XA24_9BACT|nr:hypothetical protein SP90_13635 [Halodesulfovibrio spirochaetisodalis]